MLRDDVGDRLAAQGGVEDVGGDLGVERYRERLGGRILGERRDQDRLDLVTDQGDAQPLKETPQRVGCRLALGRDGASVGPDNGQRKGHSPPRTRIVEQDRDPGGRLRGQPRLEAGNRVLADHLDPAGIDDRGGQRGRQIDRSARTADARRSDQCRLLGG